MKYLPLNPLVFLLRLKRSNYKILVISLFFSAFFTLSLALADSLQPPQGISLKELYLQDLKIHGFDELLDKLMLSNKLEKIRKKTALSKKPTNLVLYIHSAWCIHCKNSLNEVCSWISKSKDKQDNIIFVAGAWKSSTSTIDCDVFDLQGILEPRFAQTQLKVNLVPSLIIFRS